MKRIFLILTLLLNTALLVSCSNSDTDTLKDLGLDGLTAKEILELLAVDAIDDNQFNISVDDQFLILETDSNVIKLDMPTDEYYLSVAPYINLTHECYIHSATSCQGELDNKEFHVYIEDEAGNILIDDTFNSMSNGFIDLWLPRNINGTMIITYNGLEVEKDFSTFKGDNTCETTARLS